MGVIGIVDIGVANIDSVSRAFSQLEAATRICLEPDELSVVDKVVLPGVGSFAVASRLLRESGFDQAIRDSVLQRGRPILGICLGMQLLFSVGFEGGENPGLSLVAGEVRYHRGEREGIRVPHIGWNDVDHTGGLLFEDIMQGSCFYFDHSYEVIPTEELPFVAVATHGVEFMAGFESGAISGVQFHPEKSQRVGLALLRNFTNL